MIPDRFAPVLAELAPLAVRFAAAGHRLYLVGGAVRDLLPDHRRPPARRQEAARRLG
jgi:poly(A) polymerase